LTHKAAHENASIAHGTDTIARIAKGFQTIATTVTAATGSPNARTSSASGVHVS
jgi:hypothetical protein